MTTPDDQRIDDRLRDVALPRRLADAIRAESLFDDAALDRLLARVDPPHGLVDRLKAAAAAARPQGIVDLDRRAAAPQPAAVAAGRFRLGRGLTAAFRDVLAVAAVLGVVATIVAASGELSRQLGSATPADVARHEPAASGLEVAAFRPRPVSRVPPTPAPAPDAKMSAAASSVPPAAAGSAAEPAAGDLTARDVPQPTAVRGAATGSALPSSAEATALRLVRECDLPGESLRRVPRVKGYDLGFEMAFGEQPLVFPAAAPELATDTPPLCLHTDSFDRRVFEAAQTRWTPGLRAEHVLAAMPAPPHARSGEPRAARSAAASPALRVDLQAVASLRTAPRPSLLVDVAVTAARPGTSDRPPVNAVLVLDRSGGGDPLAWRWMCRGLAAVAAEMGSADRLSVVVGGGVPQLAVKAGDAAAVATLATQLEQQNPLPSIADLDAAVRAARQVEDAGGTRLHVVAHAVTVEHSREDVRTALTAWQTALATCGGEPLPGQLADTVPRFIVIDAAAPTDPPTRQPSFGRTPADPVAIRRAMVQQVFDRSTLAARQCRLDVSFDPRQVAAYRLVGHRQSAYESLATAGPAAVDLHRGETIRAVYEVFPEQAFGKGAVGATVRWRRVGDGQACEATAVLTEAPVGPSNACPAPHLCELQLAAALGDTAGGSHHLDARLPAAARALGERWRSRGDVSPFGSRLIECIERAYPDRGGPR